MKTFISTFILIFIFFMFVFFIGFGPNNDSKSIPFDHEQEGLNKQIVINFSHVVAENTPKGQAAERFAKLVAEKTNGKVKVEVFPNGVLYAEGEEVNALIRGEIQMIAPAYSNMTELLPEWLILDLPYIFKDDEHVKAVLNGEIGDSLLGELKKHNIKGIAFWSNGFKQMTSNRGPLRAPADFLGQRFRIMPSKALEDQFRELGVKTNAMPFNQVYRNLEGGYLDGGENTISNIYSKRFYKVQKYMTISNHGYLGYSVMMNQEFWDSLPKDIQKKISEAMDETTDWLYTESQKINDQQLNLIKTTSDIQIHVLSDKERENWIDFFQPLYEEYGEKYGKRWINEIQKLSN
ncbi:TRAP transporter substrate-binding protein [Schinkia azotoformans]|uniref:TRAP transporter substrate-binding protein n=1 Tax=Schinkia azotoformans TaxID=1454 RepID=UPI002DBC217F|nr:TRAP transporter substrate-binding protein [Schinkia azotoformans]MEC1717912.1 TRAP transporter substrate-binding protein [Schinkia azotoformans]MEC1741055.1 TRAP transporter substrate-binding protein [Schinkia azotoformans]MEC1744200.1 TRAP transporter substrate-binding protein [Schinkia azotoformans]MEC1756642.1 TRAP transporter substrate-binding protein [Schinkia azotoformans]MEC1768066.1 TRAP transporter substrate-binding protein [Schinkia azotoformans]